MEPGGVVEPDAASLDRLFRSESARAIATLARIFGDLQRAEDAVQEAYLEALESWPAHGTPRNPAGWILSVARNRAIDAVRREKTASKKYDLLARLEGAAISDPMTDDDPVQDDRLAMIFACAHPALAPETRVALTLRYAAGLTTEEIAAAFLVPLPTLAQRLVRAKRKIVQSGIPFSVPSPAQMPQRLPDVLAVVYLVFNEGYRSSQGGALVRVDLCADALHLARTLCRLMPGEPELLGLYALMLFHHARRATRVNERGEAAPLEEQDRERWDVVAIAQGRAALEEARRHRNPGPYQLQASIARAHATAASWDATDWPAIRRAYDALYALDPSPVVALNRAVALAFSGACDEAMREIDGLVDGPLAGYTPALIAKADLLRRAGEPAEARRWFERALPSLLTEAERRIVERRITECATA
ncbi:MAG TPA: sigma-70 family RNA polymerase sigma factor [Candidatus Baltobacteraceae bacterium]